MAENYYSGQVAKKPVSFTEEEIAKASEEIAQRPPPKEQPALGGPAPVRTNVTPPASDYESLSDYTSWSDALADLPHRLTGGRIKSAAQLERQTNLIKLAKERGIPVGHTGDVSALPQPTQYDSPLERDKKLHRIALTEKANQQMADLQAEIAVTGETYPPEKEELDAPAGSIETSVEAPRKEGDTPATKAVGTELLMQSTLPDETAEGKAATALMELGDLYKESAEAEADALTVKFGERQETKAEANLRVQLMHRERMQIAADEYEDDYADSSLTMNYPGASLFEIKKWQGDLERQATIESGDFLASPQQAQDARRKAAVAKRNLANAESIDTDRAFGNVTSKVLAALSIGLGSWASTKGGGRNTALDMYNTAITTDIAAQKEMFAHKRGAVGRTRSQYQFFMDRLKDGKAAELSVAAAGWGVAAQEFNKTAALSKNMALAQKAYAAAAEAEARSMKYKQAALKRAQELAGMSYTGVKGIRYTGGKLGRDITEHETKLLFDTIRPTIGAKSAGRQYKQAFEKAMGVKGEAAQSGALLARENFIAALGTLFEKGVLQKFEREELEKILPGQSTWAEKTWRSVTTQDRVNAAVDRLNQILEDRVDLLVEEMEFFEFDRSTKIPEKRKGRRTSTQAAQEYLAGKKTGG